MEEKENRAVTETNDLQNPVFLEELKNAEQLSSLWKVFGRESKAGKMLFKMFNHYHQPTINYPSLKTKPKTAPLALKPKKKCPQRAVVDYPTIKNKTNENNAVENLPIIPRKKPYQAIQNEIENQYKKPEIPSNKGTDREQLKLALQKKFKNSKGALLPKGVQKPIVKDSIELDEEKKDLALKKAFASGKIGIGIKKLKKIEPKIVKKPEEEELNDLFDSITEEIEERQKYLEEIEGLEMQEMKLKIKREIADRVGELQKIVEMIKLSKNKNQ